MKSTKSGRMFATLGIVWVLYIFFDNSTAFFRGWYTRHMNNPLRIVYFALRSLRSVLLFLLAVLNLALALNYLRREHPAKDSKG